MPRTMQTGGRVKQTARMPLGQKAPSKSNRVKQMSKKAQAIATGGVKKTILKKPAASTTGDAKKLKSEKKKTASERAAKHRSLVYRKMANRAGYINLPGVSVDGGAGRDALINLLSPHDVKRLIFYDPQTGDKSEKADREWLLKQLAPPKAIRHAQVRLDAMLRVIMNDAVLRTIESGNLRVSAHAIHQAIRPYIGKGRFTQGQLPPKVVVKKMIEGGEIAEPVVLIEDKSKVLDANEAAAATA